MKPARSKNYLAGIHIAFKALGLSPEDACALKMSVTGVGSAGDMTDQQRKRLLARLSSLQARSAPQRPKTASEPLDERWYKARALWSALARAGQVHTDTDAALMGYVRRQTHLDHWRFLNGHQAGNVIEALKRWCLRTGVVTQPVPDLATKEEPAHG